MDENLIKNPYWLIWQLSSYLRDDINSFAHAHDLTASQLNILLNLSLESPKPMNCLAESALCDASYITSLVDKLEAVDLLKRVEHPKDRRVKMIKLTQKGAEYQSQLIKDFAKLYQKSTVAKNISQSTVLELETLLAKTMNNQTRD
jgi:DNA-binding MarR family transcriptional regulator